MNLILKRIDYTDHGIFGALDTDNGSFHCVTLENRVLKIPNGTYPIIMYYSPEREYVVPLLQNVPDRDYIEIHAGNFEHDSKGCILVGLERAIIEGQAAISNSRNTLAQLIALIKGEPVNSLTIL